MIVEVKGNAVDGFMHRKKAVEVLKMLIEMFAREDNKLLQTSEKETVLNCCILWIRAFSAHWKANFIR